MNRETARRFITNLRSRCARDNAVAAALRRDADRTLAESRILVGWAALFHSLGIPAREEVTCHLIATLFALDRSVKLHAADDAPPVDVPASNDGEDATGMRGRSLGASMAARVATAPSEDKPLARRLNSLLNSTMEYDGSGSFPRRLRHTIILLISRGTMIDWEQLACDVSRWNHPGQFVQRAWARDFYRERPLDVHGAASADQTEQDDESTDTTDTDD